MEKIRTWKLDNIKAILIFLVVLGHLFDLHNKGFINFLFIVIYFFHMPAFVFCSGYLSKPRNKKAIVKYLILYIGMQTIYYLFCNYCLGEDKKLTYYTPYRSLWFLLALFIWNVLLIFFDTNSYKKQILIILSSIILGLLIGYISYPSLKIFSISRIFVYLPFFLAGYYLKKNDITFLWKEKLSNNSKKVISAIFMIIMVGILFYIWQSYKQWDYEWLYGSISYKDGGYGPQERLIQYIIAILCIISLLWFIQNKKYKFTYIGKYTLIIYLLHNFIIRIIDNVRVLSDNQYIFLLQTIIIAVVLTTVLPILPIAKENLMNLKERKGIKNGEKDIGKL